MSEADLLPYHYEKDCLHPEPKVGPRYKKDKDGKIYKINCCKGCFENPDRLPKGKDVNL